MNGCEPEPAKAARHFLFRGAVQGYGIRPTIARLANDCELTGYVSNDCHGVIAHVEGSLEAIERFSRQASARLHCLTQVSAMEMTEAVPLPAVDFRILPSQTGGRLATVVPVDRKICDVCLSEVRDPHHRRYAHPFNHCTACGPRYSILQALPYDRERTSMRNFAMCDDCQIEYQTVGDRRFHSQTQCCPACGPRLWFQRGSLVISAQPIQAAAAVIGEGGIVAIKGVGGYQLVCDATNPLAVERLRQRKIRPRKPLAILLDEGTWKQLTHQLTACERRTLAEPSGPIVLLDRVEPGPVVPTVSQGLATLGVMLPTTALHAMLLDEVQRPLVVTSGNREGEPLVYRNEDAVVQLGNLADAFLHHDREIVRPIDDSVVRCLDDRVMTLRAARGLAPMPLPLAGGQPCLAVGGQQKNAIAIANGYQAVLGPHLGELDSVAGRQRWEQYVRDSRSLFHSDRGSIATDLHPDFFGTRWSETQPASISAVQHHHAHVVAAMCENGWLDQTVLGVAMDGTGLGEDGSLRGGEFMIATASQYRLVGTLRPLPLLGGEAAIRQPQRLGFALLQAALPDRPEEVAELCQLTSARCAAYEHLLDKPRWSPRTTSVGRLFDGIAAILLKDIQPQFEGEMAMRLESLCDLTDTVVYPFPLDEDRIQGTFLVDWRPMVRELVADLHRGIPNSRIAMRFHRGLAQVIHQVLQTYHSYRAVLAGGVFQNLVLHACLQRQWSPTASARVGWCMRIPTNDGGLAAGQLAITLARQSQAEAVVAFPTPEVHQVSPCA
jgi:hydrogenase maturation protein HypF